jgi:hypothetical protein
MGARAALHMHLPCSVCIMAGMCTFTAATASVHIACCALCTVHVACKWWWWIAAHALLLHSSGAACRHTSDQHIIAPVYVQALWCAAMQGNTYAGALALKHTHPSCNLPHQAHGATCSDNFQAANKQSLQLLCICKNSAAYTPLSYSRGFSCLGTTLLQLAYNDSFKSRQQSQHGHITGEADYFNIALLTPVHQPYVVLH